MNNSLFAALTLTALAAFAPGATQAQDAPRQRIRLDAGWRFQMAAPTVLKGSVAVNSWRWKAHDNALADAATVAAPGYDASGPDWQAAAPGDDVFHGRVGLAWFRTTLPNVPGPGRTLHLRADDNAVVFLNGTQLLYHAGWNQPFDVPLDAAWKPGGPNVIGVMSATSDPSQPGFNDRAWRTVLLPHDYVVEGKFTPTVDASHGSLPTAPAWYRKTFRLPASDKGKSVWIDFDGVYRDSKVWLNGVLLGEHPSGYTSFRYDISKAAHYGGVNTLAVHVDPTAQEGWWYEGGGIYRHVWLNVASPLHVAPWGTFVTSAVKDTLGKPSATLTIKTTLNGSGMAGSRVISLIYGPGGGLVASATSGLTMATYDPPQEVTVTQQVAIPHSRLWSLETPLMYRLHTVVQESGRTVNTGNTVDTYDTPFGIRTIRFDPATGFYLNGRPVKILGTCNHQDFAGVGTAMPDSVLYWRTKKLKEMGSNAVRMSHNLPAPELLDACDKLGMLVMDENRHLGDTESPKTPSGTGYSDLSELTSMILRDRNHPSIILWSLCNEEGLQGSVEGARIFAAMRERVRQFGTTRPVTCAMNGGYDQPRGITSVEDIQGINYNPGGYAPFHKAHPDMPLFGSETASTVSTRGIYSLSTFHTDKDYTGVPEKGYVSAYDLNAPPWAQTAEDSWTPQADNASVAGGFAWTGFDYKGEPTPFGWPDINSNFGLLDVCGFPKDVYHYYQSWWLSRPIVHVFPHWNWPGKEGQSIPVWVYSNAARVELIVNGQSLGTREMPRNGQVEWPVSYAPGTVLAKGYDANGKVVGTDSVATTGAAALRLTTGRVALSADGEDFSMVTVSVVDAQGRLVPTADNRVTFHVAGMGHVAGVGNGDPSDHDPDKASSRRAFSGLCLVVVGAGEHPGPIRLTATSPGLAPASLSLSAR